MDGMNQNITSKDLELLNKGLSASGIRLSLEGDAESPFEINCNYINNPDGTLRWIWPQTSRSASFLKFYHTGSLRSRLAAAAMKAAMKLGWDKAVISGKAKIYANETTSVLTTKIKDWALFTGTVGDNRKLVVWYQNHYGSYFAKFPLSPGSLANVQNEISALGRPSVPGMIKPRIEVINSTILLQTDLYEQQQHALTPGSISTLPERALIQWCSNGRERVQLDNSNWWLQVSKRLQNLRRDNRYAPVLVQRLNDLAARMPVKETLTMAPAHGDFTPWNIKANRENIYAVDWEMYHPQKPMLFDVFHYIYQSNILIGHHPYKKIRAEIDALFAQPAWQEMLTANSINKEDAEQLYLLDIISYYLDLYSRQEDWHMQVNWLLQVWNEATGYWLTRSGKLNSRQAVLQDITFQLWNKQYAVFKLKADDVKDISQGSDVDICIARKDATSLRRYLQQHVLAGAVSRERKTFMTNLRLLLSDNQMLHLDLIWSVKRKHVEFLNAADILKYASTTASGVKIPSALHDVQYTWMFYTLNGAPLPVRYQQWWEDSILYRIACSSMAKKYGMEATPEDFFQFRQQAHDRLLTALKTKPANRNLPGLANRAAYVLDCLKTLLPRRGFIATFSGVDGAGKSTVIENVSRTIEKEMRIPVVVLRHRPSILPILSAWKYGKEQAEQRSVNRLPRTGANQSGWSSLVRFLYYYMDYLLGQFYIQFRYVYRGYAVLYDRYYFDFINDSKRSNIVISRKLSLWLYSFLLKPDFNYFLFAPADVILQRKQELDKQTIHELTGSYLSLFSSLSRKDKKHTYDAICNLQLDTTLDAIICHLKKKQK